MSSEKQRMPFLAMAIIKIKKRSLKSKQQRLKHKYLYKTGSIMIKFKTYSVTLVFGSEPTDTTAYLVIELNVKDLTYPVSVFIPSLVQFAPSEGTAPEEMVDIPLGSIGRRLPESVLKGKTFLLRCVKYNYLEVNACHSEGKLKVSLICSLVID